jgi:hypothetical protein
MGHDQEHGQPVALPEQGIANRFEIETGLGICHGGENQYWE